MTKPDFAAQQWILKKEGKTNAVWFLDLFLGKDYCVHAFIDWKLENS